MATVYLAEDLKHRRQVAVKVLHPDLASILGRTRFLREIEIAASLIHPGIIPLYDSGATDGITYYVMPYVEGDSLRERLDREKQLPLEDALRIAREVGDALSHAHAHQIIHRDIKPANILLSGGHALVADFGIARAVTAAGGEQITTSGLAVGTPAYMSPEQASAKDPVDQRSDVYALGCVVYEMLAGQPPFTGATAQAVLAQHRLEHPPSLEVVRPGVGYGVQHVVDRALAKAPADRFQTVAEFVAALEQAAIAPESGEYSKAHGAAPIRTWVAAVSALAVVAAGVAAFLLLGRAPRLDDRKLVVFPLQARGDTSMRADGVRLGSLINTALELAEPLQAADGWTWLTPAQKNDPTLITSADLARIARAQGARYALNGWVLHEGDSATVTVALLDVVADTTLPQVSQAGLFGPDFVADLGLRAVNGMLSRFLALGRSVDLPLLQGHPLAAVVATVSGDVAYRDARFDRALDHYRHALQLDSTMLLAAIKGASAANWNHDQAGAKALVEVAVRHSGRAPAKYRDFAAGLLAYLADDPDSAQAGYSRAIARDSGWTEAWMARGEVYYHFLVGWNPDSLAERDFQRAHELDPGFTPALFHLAEIALRRGWSLRADSLYRALRRAGPDSTWLHRATWMMRCVRGGPDGVDWPRTARAAGAAVYDLVATGHALARAQPGCAERAAAAALAQAPAESVTTRFAALSVLNALLVAQGRYPEVRRLLRWGADSVHAAAHNLQLVDAVAGVGTDSEATAALRLLGGPASDLRGRSPRWLWWHGVWAWLHRDVARLAQVVAVAADTMRVGQADGVDTLVRGGMAARLALLRADTARAIAILSVLSPRGTMPELAFEWLGSLPEERLLLAQLLLAKRRYAEALQVAGVFDASQPLAYAMYLPASLDVRIRAARALGLEALAISCEAHLRALRMPR